MKRIALTLGEPAGIGPDLIIKLAAAGFPKSLVNSEQEGCELVIIADKHLLAQRAQQLNLPFHAENYHKNASPSATIKILHVPAANVDCCGEPDNANASYVIETLRLATEACLQQEFAALCTGPVHKATLNDAGFAFSGHTEWLAKLSDVKRTVMLFQAGSMRVALATTHLPLAKVSETITQELLSETLHILRQGLQQYFHIPNPNIYLCGLNPHAGEGGHLGHEEIDVIIPVMERLQQQGYNLFGPFAADTVFLPQMSQQVGQAAHCILAMYHDQALPVIKQLHFDDAVNITLGLPFLRSSVDHGTAFDLAGTGKANTGSFKQAIMTAVKLSQLERLRYET